MILLEMYIMCAIFAFLYEWSNFSGWKMSLLISIFYPVTMFLGVIVGIVMLFKRMSAFVKSFLKSKST